MSSDFESISKPTGIIDSAEHAVKAAKNLAEGNINVFSAEFAVAMAKLRPKLSRLAMSATLIALGLIALLAFVIIGLGELLGQRYWLSSLIATVLCGFFGLPMWRRSFDGVSEIFQFERTLRSVDRTVAVAKQTFEEIKSAASGDNRESVTTGKN